MSSWFELIKGADGQYSFDLKDSNGETLLIGKQPYISRGSAKADIEVIQRNCSYINRYDAKESPNGEYYFDLHSPNHQVIATSQRYESAESRDAAIATVRSDGKTRTVRA
ncbi:MAG: YegP family protein [Porticoccus sp.]